MTDQVCHDHSRLCDAVAVVVDIVSRMPAALHHLSN